MLQNGSCRGALVGILLLVAVSPGTAIHSSAGAISPSVPAGVPLGADVPPTQLDDRPEAFMPQTPRSPAEQDRLDAMALFATGRTHERRQELDDALRCYQRALRLDRQAATIARQVVRVAVRLKRSALAVRYAAIAAELDSTTDEALPKLAAYLAGEGQIERAVGLLEKAMASQDGAEPKTANALLLHLDLGRYHFLLDHHEKAAEHFAVVEAAVRHPESAGLTAEQANALLEQPGPMFHLFGETFLLAGRIDEAVAAFDEANRREPSEPLRAYCMARVARKRGQPQEALDALQAYFDAKRDAEGTDPYRLAADLLAELGREAETLDYLARLHAANPDSEPLSCFLADRYFDAKKFDQAEPLYAGLASDDFALAGLVGRIRVYRATSDPDKLLEALGRIAAKTSSLEPLEDGLADLAADAATFDALVAAARRQLQADAASLDFGKRLAVALLALEGGNPEVAGEFLELAMAADGSKKNELLLLWGAGLMATDAAPQAADVFRRGAEDEQLAAQRPVFCHYLAIALEAGNRTEEALAAIHEAMELSPDDARFASRRAWIYYHARRYPEAREAYLDVVKRFGDQYGSAAVRATVREARLALSNLCANLGQKQEGEEWLEQVLDEFPEDPSALNDLGYLWAEQGKHLHRSLWMLEKAVATEPDNPAYRDSLGWVYYQSGRYEESLAELLKAAETQEPDGVILDHLGDAYRKLGRGDEARSAWRRAADAFRAEEEESRAAAVESKLAEP